MQLFHRLYARGQNILIFFFPTKSRRGRVLPRHNGKRRILAIFFAVEGVLLFIYSVWRLVIKPLEFYRDPPGLDFVAKIFIFLMFVAGILFVSRALSLLKGSVKPSSSDLTASVLSIPLWGFPALIAMGNANTYLTSPYIPEELRPVGFYYLQIGALFIVIGIFNLLSVFLSMYLLKVRTSSDN